MNHSMSLFYILYRILCHTLSHFVYITGHIVILMALHLTIWMGLSPKAMANFGMMAGAGAYGAFQGCPRWLRRK